MNHSPTPWIADNYRDEVWTHDHSRRVAQIISWPKQEGNAEFICRAVNNHERLVQALKLVVARLEEYPDAIDGIALEGARAAIEATEKE